MNYDEIRRAADTVASRSGRESHRVALVLGSGLGEYAETLDDTVTIPYQEVPGFPVPAVEGHAGRLVSAIVGSAPVLVLAGRVHCYEGWTLQEVVFGVRVAVACGAGIVVLTNAAGGAGDGLQPGDLVLISDHINLASRNPLVGPNDDRLGPRFPDMSAVYPEELRVAARRTGDEVGVPLRDGVYAWFLGPSYETPAEVQMAKRLGADLVGMSTVPEAVAVQHMGGRVLGISLVTNLAAGISPVPLSHEEVTRTADEARERFGRLLDALLPVLVR